MLFINNSIDVKPLFSGHANEIKIKKVDNLELLIPPWNDEILLRSYMQKAFEGKYWDLVLLLLSYGCPFPRNFSINLIPKQQVELLELINTHQKYTELISRGALDQVIDGVDKNIINHKFRSVDNKSAVSIAFYKKQFETFVLLKSRGFKEFSNESPLRINYLSQKEQKRVKLAMFNLKMGYRLLPIKN